MGSSPSFFIITISWNNHAGLQTTLQSLLEQRYPGWRGCVIDGASTDASLSYLQTLNDPRLSWVSEKDQGIYNAMNKGIARIPADADYVIFMNSGDCFENTQVLETLSEQINLYRDNHGQTPDLLVGSSRNVSEEVTRRIRRPLPLWWRYIGMVAEHQATVFKAALLRQHPFDESYRMSSDYAHFCQLFTRRPPPTLHYVDTLLCRFYLGGVSASRREEALREEKRIRHEILHMHLFFCFLIEIAQRVRYAFKKIRQQV